MADTLLQKLLASVIYDLNNISEISNIFIDIFSSPRKEFKYPSLMVDIGDIADNNGYYGFYDTKFWFTIIHKGHRSDAIGYFDILLKNFNKFKGSNNPDYVVSYIAEYTGSYDEVFDLDSNEIFLSSVWRIRAIIS